MEELVSLGALSALAQVILVDLVLAGDNAISSSRWRRRGCRPTSAPGSSRSAIFLAVVMRIGFALVTVQLLQITGVLFLGGVLLAWVCWKLWQELRAHVDHARATATRAVDKLHPEKKDKTMFQAIVQIVIRRSVDVARQRARGRRRGPRAHLGAGLRPAALGGADGGGGDTRGARALHPPVDRLCRAGV